MQITIRIIEIQNRKFSSFYPTEMIQNGLKIDLTEEFTDISHLIKS